MFGSIEGEKGKPLQFEAAPVYEQSPCSEGTCRLAHLRMPTRSRGLERKDLLSRANEHRLLGIGDEIQGS